MRDLEDMVTADKNPAVKKIWQAPDYDTLSARGTANNGLVAPGDGTFSPSPSGS